MRFASYAAAIFVAAALIITSAQAADISGVGATFPYPIYAKWADTYKKDTGNGLNYQSIGSGGGIKQIQAKTVTFGATDKPLDEKALNESGLIQFPMVMGGIVPVINVGGIKAGEIVLDGPTLAKIFLGEITKWDDPAIKKLNEKAALPSTAIAVVHRSDGSGTTFNFTNYLNKVSPAWKDKVGSDASVEWPVGIGAKGNEGVANNVKQTKGAIGYVEYAYAKQNKFTFADMINKDGNRVAPDMKSFQAAAENADWKAVPGFAVILTEQPGAGSWPITAATFILMHKEPADAAASALALKFFDWAYKTATRLPRSLTTSRCPTAWWNSLTKSGPRSRILPESQCFPCSEDLQEQWMVPTALAGDAPARTRSTSNLPLAKGAG